MVSGLPDNSAVARFLRACETHTDRPAVVEANRTTSYGELRQRVWQISGALQKFPAGLRVAIVMEKSVEAYAAIYGALHAGAVYAPLNTGAPDSRNATIVAQFKPDVVLADKPLSEALSQAAGKAVMLDLNDLPGGEPIAARDGKLAYVMFTSGSTGVPKGVMISRSALDHYIDWIVGSFAATPDDRWSQHPNIGFDLSVLDIFGALSQGAALYPLISERSLLMPARFIRDNQLTIWNSVPSVVDLMSRSRQLTADNMASLRLATFCGEPLMARHVDLLFDAKPELRVQNTYGPTEATVSCTAIDLQADAAREGSIEIGPPIAGMRLLIDTEQGVEIPGGTQSLSGELLIAGPQLADGYWNAPDKTAAAFQTVQSDGGQIAVYRTGDHVEAAGPVITFKGRIDDQVKINGYRIELNEIDLAASELGLGTACAIAKDGALHLFFETSRAIDEAEVAAGLGARLPSYAIPRRISTVTRLPRNSNDKIDRKQLGEGLE